MNGWQIFKKIKENNKWDRIPIIFLSAKKDGLNKGYGKILSEGFIEKPFDIRDLEQRIGEVLENLKV